MSFPRPAPFNLNSANPTFSTRTLASSVVFYENVSMKLNSSTLRLRFS